MDLAFLMNMLSMAQSFILLLTGNCGEYELSKVIDFLLITVLNASSSVINKPL